MRGSKGDPRTPMEPRLNCVLAVICAQQWMFNLMSQALLLLLLVLLWALLLVVTPLLIPVPVPSASSECHLDSRPHRVVGWGHLHLALLYCHL